MSCHSSGVSATTVLRRPPSPTPNTLASQCRMFTARATTSTMITIDSPDWSIISSFAGRESGITSVGLNAVPFVNEKYR